MDAQRLGGIERVLVKNDDSIRAWIWQGSKQNGIHDGEDGGVCANADRERGRRDDAEGGSPPKRAECVSGVLTKAVDQCEPARIAALFLPLIDRTHLPKRCVSSIGGRHAASDMVFNEMLQMVLELFVEFPFDLGASQQRTDTQTELSGPAHGARILTRASQSARLRPTDVPTGRSRS